MQRFVVGMWWLVAACAPPGTGEVGEDPPVRPEVGAPPVDPVQIAARATVPIYGGTMAASATRVVAADPGRDEVHVAEPGSRVFAPVTLALPEHSEPFRVAIDDEVAVLTLRGSGEVAVVDLQSAALLRTGPVCPEPRGIAIDGDELLVACATGELVELGRDLEVLRRATIEPDLRDVVVEGDTVWVSTLRAAAVLELDRATLTLRRRVLPDLGSTDLGPAAARVGWRMRAHPDGGVLLLHLGATTEPIALDGDIDPEEPSSPYGGTRGDVVTCEPSTLRSSTHFTRVTRTDARTGAPLLSRGPRYDFVIDGGRVYLPSGSTKFFRERFPSTPGFVTTARLDEIEDPVGCVSDEPMVESYGIAASITAFDGEPWTFSREPSRLARGTAMIVLGEPDDASPAHEVFHATLRSGLACASCHPEAQDDGHTWSFAGVGPRRTQNLAGGVSARAPFHWDGEFATLDDLLEEVFTFRMGGELVPPEVTDELDEWLDGVPALRGTDSPDATKGRALFESAEVGCASCHVGEQLTDSQLHTVRQGEPPIKTPSLLGVGGRGPWMHDGCADTLERRFLDDACGGGDLHGTTSQLDADGISALVSYLQSL